MEQKAKVVNDVMGVWLVCPFCHYQQVLDQKTTAAVNEDQILTQRA